MCLSTATTCYLGLVPLGGQWPMRAAPLRFLRSARSPVPPPLCGKTSIDLLGISLASVSGHQHHDG